MDNEGNLGWRAGSEPGPTLLEETISGEYMGVDDTIVQYVDGWTLQDYINSEYNTDLYISSDKYAVLGNDSWYFYSPDGPSGTAVSSNQGKNDLIGQYNYEYTD